MVLVLAQWADGALQCHVSSRRLRLTGVAAMGRRRATVSGRLRLPRRGSTAHDSITFAVGDRASWACFGDPYIRIAPGVGSGIGGRGCCVFVPRGLSI